METITYEARRVGGWAVALLCALLVGCGGGGATSTDGSTSGAPPAPPPPSGSITLAWDGPTTNADAGSSPLSDLAGYRVYLSTTAGQYTNSPIREVPLQTPGTTEQITVSNLAAGTYYFIVTARDSSGNESVYSNEVQVTVP